MQPADWFEFVALSYPITTFDPNPYFHCFLIGSRENVQETTISGSKTMASYKFSRNKSIGFFRCQSVDLQVAQPTTRETSVGHDWMVCCWCVVWSCRQRVGKTMHEAFGGPTYLHIPTLYLHTYLPTHPHACMQCIIYTQCSVCDSITTVCDLADLTIKGALKTFKNHIHQISANYFFPMQKDICFQTKPILIWW